MRWQLRDPEVRRKAWPDYTFGCKRVLFSSQFLPALQRAERRARHRADRALDAGGDRDRRGHRARGRLHHLRHRLPDHRVHVPDGGHRRRAGARCARPGPTARTPTWGSRVPGFPSLFLMYGPNTNTSGGSIIFYEETQAAYIRQALEHVRRAGGGGDRGPPRGRGGERPRAAGPLRRHGVDQCDSWYRNEDGRIVTNWPGYMREYARAAADARSERVRARAAQDRERGRGVAPTYTRLRHDRRTRRPDRGALRASSRAELSDPEVIGDRERFTAGQPGVPRARAGRPAGRRVPARARRLGGRARAAGRGRRGSRAARAARRLARAPRTRWRRRSAWRWSSATPTTTRT